MIGNYFGEKMITSITWLKIKYFIITIKEINIIFLMEVELNYNKIPSL